MFGEGQIGIQADTPTTLSELSWIYSDSPAKLTESISFVLWKISSISVLEVLRDIVEDFKSYGK